MTTEEKAKAYDEAIERANDILKGYNPKEGSKATINYIFPQLKEKESEDERIRGAIIDHLKDYNLTEWAAWLEKQSNEPKWCHHKVDLSDCSEEYRKAYYDGWNNCNQQHSQCKSEGNDVVKCLINGMKFYYELNEEITWGTAKFSMKVKDILAWLEKQGKETSEKEFTFKALPRLLEMIEVSDRAKAYTEKLAVALDNEGYHTDAKIVRESIKIMNGEEVPMATMDEQKPVDNIEPKFKVGDWITDGNNALLCVEKFEIDYGYELKATDDQIFHFVSPNLVDANYHLWTIQDAKDGDVLCTYECDEPKIVFILKGTPKKHYALSYHCYYNIMYPHFASDSEKGCLAPNDEDVKPATKEQRDLLFQKIKEEEYEWDAERKELKKINKNTDVGHEYFSDLLEKDDCDNIDDYAYQCAYCMSHDWIKESPTWDDVERACKLGAEWNEKHHKSAWSEEDKDFMYDTLSNLAELKGRYGEGYGNVGKCIDWLKSIKDRIQPIHEYSDTEKQEMFIRSQRPHFWRPSDEQMDALNDVISSRDIKYDVLSELWKDLNKLRGK